MYVHSNCIFVPSYKSYISSGLKTLHFLQLSIHEQPGEDGHILVMKGM